MMPNSNSNPMFDVGPLSWVKAEIEHSLTEARVHLDALKANPGDTKSIKYAANHLHQVTGALTMVGLGAATRFTEEVEQLTASLETDPTARGNAPQRINTILAATASLSAYLDSLMAGEPDRPMLLASAYIEVNKARGATTASESDLFAPDLSLSLPIPENTIALPKPEMIAEAIKQRRAMYQAGLLKLLRDKDMAGGSRDMRNATLAIEALQSTSPTVSFWYAASGFFDAVASNPVEAGTVAVQLFGKIDQQIKLLIEGVHKVPEKLFRDILLVIGRSKATTDRLVKIRELYRLDELLAMPVSHSALGADDKLKATIRSLRDRVQEQKDNWLKFTGGSRSSLDQFITDSSPFFTTCQQQPNKTLTEIVQTLGAVGAHFRKTQGVPNETQSLEVASALLFLESAFENYFHQSTDLDAQASNVVSRLKGAMTGATLPAIVASTDALMDDISKRAQERMLMFQVGQEVQVNLANIESALDTFFRDATKTAALSTVGPLFSQVQGALTMLELSEAASLNQILSESISHFATGELATVGEGAEAVAEGVSALGLYIAALQRGVANPRETLLPTLIRFGIVAKPVEKERTINNQPISRADIDVGKQKVQERYEEWKLKPEETTSRDHLRQAVEELKQDATLIADGESARQSDDVLKAIDQTFDPHKSGIMSALSVMVPNNPIETPATQTVQLLDAPTSEVDLELLAIFLEEADEVVATIREQLEALRESPALTEPIITIRRGYHTLKGSGRMVGLSDLGDVAWNCEQVFNKWLKDEKPATKGLLGFVDHTVGEFDKWIQALNACGAADIDGSDIARMSERLKNGEEPNLPIAPPAEAPPVPSVEVPQLAPVVVEDVEDLVEIADIADEEPASITPVVLENVEPASELAVEAVPAFALAATEDSVISEFADVEPLAAVTAETPPPLPLVEFEAPVPPPIVAARPIVEVFEAPVSAVVAEIPPAADVVEVPEPTSIPDDFSIESDAALSLTDDIRIGNIEVSGALFDIYLDEAQEHVATLDNEMTALEQKPGQVVSYEFMRAAHTLTSSSRTTNFNMIADVASALEKWSHDAIELTPPLDTRRLDVMRQAVDALGSMVLGLHTHEEPDARADVVLDLQELREALKQGKRADAGRASAPHVPLEASGPEAAPVAFAPHHDEPIIAPAPTPSEAPSPWNDAPETSAATPLPEPPAPPAPPAEISEPFAFDPTLLFAVAGTAAVGLAAAGAAEPTAEQPAPAPDVATDAQNLEIDFFAETPTQPALDAEVSIEEVNIEDAPSSTAAEPPALTWTDEFIPEPEAPITPAIVAEPVSPSIPAAAAFAFLTPTPEPLLPVVEPAFESGKEKRRIEDDIDADLLPIFLEETKEIAPLVGDGLRTWRATPEDHRPVQELARHFHTLKGSARMAGLMRLGELAHVIESKMVAMDAVAAPSAAMFDDIDECFDRFIGTLDRLQAGDQVGEAIDVPVVDVFEHQRDKPGAIAVMAAAAQAVRDETLPEGRERQSLLRVNADIIDRFVNEAGELSIARSRVEQEMLTFKQSLVELTENISRMKTQLREVEIQSESQIQSRIKEAEEHGAAFDPLEFDRFSRTQELTRFMAESLNDVVTLQLSLQKNLDETESALLQQSRLNRDLQQGLMSVRLVPLGNLQDRFYRLVRQTAKELDKKANLEFRGVRVEIDRSVLEKITPPFEHLLRNAVAHGLEMPADRTKHGKSEIGEITIDAQQVGNEVVLTLTDDGGGLNFARIREKAIEKHLLAVDAEVSEAQLTQYIFMAGFSTADAITQVSGRGVGMDVVRNEIVSLGGRIDITSIAGRGTTFTIALPLTLAVTQAVMVVVGDIQYAIPSVMIEQVQEYKGKRYEPLLGMHEIDWKGNKYPLRSMAALLGGKPTVSVLRKAFVILAKSGQQRAAVQVDQIIGNREIVVKTIGPQLARLIGVAGATVTGAGKIILIINPVQLHYREAATVTLELEPTNEVASPEGALSSTGIEGDVAAPVHAEVSHAPSLGEAIAAAAPAIGTPAETPVLARAVPLVMVVDDSLTVRKITSRMLTREGFEFTTAKDGVDGLQQLQDIEPDIILLDIEMPRMDGFEFARNVRADAKTRAIPIIMITSRTADKHRNRALELGVNEYMGKPYQEDQLIELIRRYTKHITANH